jgi:hypothetical protein
MGLAEESVVQRVKDANTAFSQQQKTVAGNSAEIEKFNAQLKNIPKSIVGGANKELEEMRKKIQAGGLQVDALNTAIGLTKNRLQQLTPGTKVYEDLQNELKASVVANENLNRSFTSTRSEITAMREALLQLEKANLQGTEVFKNLSLEAGELSDRAGDAQQRVKALASDTLELDTGVAAIQGVTGAFAALQGVAALAGDENEQFQKTLLQVNAAMAILTGLQQVQNTIQKDNILVIVTENALRKISAASTALQSAAESRFTIVRVAATAAQKALNAVMAANPATVVLVAIAALAAGLLLLTSRTDDSAEAQERLERSMKATAESADFQAQIIANQAQNNQRDIALLKARGATRAAVAAAEINSIKQQIEAERDYQQQFTERSGSEEQFTASLRREVGLRSELRIAELENSKAALQEEKQVRDKFLKDQVAANEIAVIEAADGFRKLDAEISKINASLRAELANPDLTTNQRVLAEIKAGEDIRQAREKLLGDIQRLTRDHNIKITILEQERLLDAAKNAQTELLIKQQLVQQEINLTELRIQREKEARQRANEFIFTSTLNIAASLSQVTQNSAQQQLDSLQKQLDQGIISQKQFQDQSLAIRRRAAQQEKQYSLFSAILQQSLAILKVFSDSSIPVYLRPIYIAATIAQTAAQIAAITSAPLPSFAKGTKSAPGGLSLVAEKGSELVYNEGVWAYHKKATVLDLQKGATVIPAASTRRIMQDYGMKIPTFSPAEMSQQKEKIDYEKFASAVGKELAKLPLQINRWDESGYSSYSSSIAQEKTFVNTRYNSPK